MKEYMKGAYILVKVITSETRKFQRIFCCGKKTHFVPLSLLKICVFRVPFNDPSVLQTQRPQNTSSSVISFVIFRQSGFAKGSFCGGICHCNVITGMQRDLHLPPVAPIPLIGRSGPGLANKGVGILVQSSFVTKTRPAY